MMSSRRLLLCLLVSSVTAVAAGIPGHTLKLNLRTRVEAFKGSGDWQEVHFEKMQPTSHTAILICDMWDKHWCTGASRRVAALAARMEPVVAAGRANGIQIIHAPSEVMDFYKDTPDNRDLLLGRLEVERQKDYREALLRQLRDEANLSVNEEEVQRVKEPRNLREE